MLNLIDVPDPRGVPEAVAFRLAEAIKSMCKRDVGGMVEQNLKECHTYARALDIASRPITLPHELTQSDRRELDDAVFELLGVSDSKERSRLIDRLYIETTRHFATSV